MSSETQRHGFWPSSITPANMVTGGRRYGFTKFDREGRATWTEQRPDEGGRVVIMRANGEGACEALTPNDLNARTRVHEYGGRPHVFVDDGLWTANYADQRLVHLVDDARVATSQGEGWRFAEPLHDARRDRIVAVGEKHGDDHAHPENGIVRVSVDGEVEWLVRGHDFFAAPRLSPRGDRLAFIAWDHPHMSWDAAALYVAPVLDDGSIGPAQHIAGNANASVNDVLWRDDDELIFTLEVDDRWQPHSWNGRTVRRLADVPGEVGVPQWTIGTHVMTLATRDRLVCVSQRGGLSVVYEVGIDDGTVRLLRDDLPHVGHIDAHGDALLMVLGFNMQGPAVILARTGHDDRVLAGAIPRGAKPEALRFETDGGEAFAFFHRPDPEAGVHPVDGERSPLLVLVHGGPTGATSPLPTLPIRFWTTRGFAVLDVNYRGSTGFGRAYRDALRGRWGEVDVADCVAGVRHLVRRGDVRDDALFIRGGSAGGYTVLQALCDYDLFRGGACHYGISDPRALSAQTHKFEARYDDLLFGVGAAREEALAKRTPLDHPERITAPMIFFQGKEDLAVLPEQTEKIHRALVSRGVPSEFNLYEGEQHGFRRGTTIIDVLTRELAFYQRILGAAGR